MRSWIQRAPAEHSRPAWTACGIPVPSWVRHITGNLLRGSSGIAGGLLFRSGPAQGPVGVRGIGLVPDRSQHRCAVKAQLRAALEAVGLDAPDGEHPGAAGIPRPHEDRLELLPREIRRRAVERLREGREDRAEQERPVAAEVAPQRVQIMAGAAYAPGLGIPAPVLLMAPAPAQLLDQGVVLVEDEPRPPGRRQAEEPGLQ